MAKPEYEINTEVNYCTFKESSTNDGELEVDEVFYGITTDAYHKQGIGVVSGWYYQVDIGNTGNDIIELHECALQEVYNVK